MHYDFYRKFYVAFSRAQDLLVLVAGEDMMQGRYGPWIAGPYEGYNKILAGIPEYNKNMDLRGLALKEIKQSNVKKTLSFTSHIAKYDECPREYMFLKEFEFSPVKAGSFLFGTLVHQTIEDVHRAVLRGEEELITDENIELWFDANYASLLKQQHAHALAPKVKMAALEQVKRYVKRRGGDWSSIRETEVDVSLVEGDYIIGGTIDLIQGQGDTVELVDFKSEKNPLHITVETTKAEKERKKRELARLERYKKQLRIYAHLVEERTGHTVSAMNLHYTGEDSDDYIIRIPYERKDVQESIREFDDTAKRILRKEYDIEGMCDKQVCSECSFRYYCEKSIANVDSLW